MTTVAYSHVFGYRYDEGGQRFPQLSFRVANPQDPSLAVDVDAFLDSGTERTLIDGQVAAILGLELFEGPRLTFETTAGGLLPAVQHRVVLAHAELGSFEMLTAFSTAAIRRNLLGRDFFDQVQIGFRERHFEFYVSPTP